MVNVGLSGILLLFLSLIVPLVLVVLIVVAFMRIIRASERTAKRLDDIYQLLQNKSDG